MAHNDDVRHHLRDVIHKERLQAKNYYYHMQTQASYTFLSPAPFFLSVVEYSRCLSSERKANVSGTERPFF